MNRLFCSLFAALALSFVLSALLFAQPSSGDKLIELIKREQAKNVKKSVGTDAYQCFTDNDLARFKDSGRSRKIVEGLKSDPQFKAVVDSLQKMSESERRSALAKARGTAQPTWAAMGYIDKDGKGQSEAGRLAQLEISERIVQTVEEMLGK